MQQVRGQLLANGADFTGYEIHAGQTFGADAGRPIALIDNQAHGACSPDGLVNGLYIHGLFDRSHARAGLLGLAQTGPSASDHADVVDAALDAIAATLEHNLNLDHLYKLACLK